MGFDQAKNIREYRFDGVGAGETAKHFVVSADLALFVTYHVGLQEGPALCLKRLSADLETLQQSPHELTSIDLAEGATTCSQGDRPRVWRCLPENTFRSGRLGPQT